MSKQNYPTNYIKAMHPWKKLEFIHITNQPCLFHSCHTSHFVQDKLVIFLGEEAFETMTTDAHFVYDLSTMIVEKRKCRTNPIERRNHATVLVDGKVYLFGGDAWPLRNDMWIYDIQANTFEFQDTLGKTPLARRYHVMTHNNGFIYLFGGDSAYGGSTSNPNGTHISMNDLHRFNISQNLWTVIHTKESPPGRRYSSLESVKNSLWLFAGRNSKIRFNDMWRFDLKVMQWISITYSNGTKPCPRAAMTSCVIDTSIFYFGGNSDDGPSNGLWEFHTETYTWKLIDTGYDKFYQPIPRYWHSMCVSPKNEIFISGGHDMVDKGNIDDVWVITPWVKKSYIQPKILTTCRHFDDVDILFFA